MKKKRLNDSVWITMLTSLASGTALICVGAVVVALTPIPVISAERPPSDAPALMQSSPAPHHRIS